MPQRIDELPPLFPLAANEKAAITATASIGESTASPGWCYDEISGADMDVDCYDELQLLWLPSHEAGPRKAHSGLFKRATLADYLPSSPLLTPQAADHHASYDSGSFH